MISKNRPPDVERDQEPLAPEEIATVRELLPYAETIKEGAVSRDRWRWLRSLSGSMVTWAGIGLALLASMKDEITALFKGNP